MKLGQIFIFLLLVFLSVSSFGQESKKGGSKSWSKGDSVAAIAEWRQLEYH